MHAESGRGLGMTLQLNRQNEDEERRLEQEQAGHSCQQVRASGLRKPKHDLQALVCLNLWAVRARGERRHLFSEATADQIGHRMLMPDHILELDHTRPVLTLTTEESAMHAQLVISHSHGA